jgi:hypothetical protein
MKNPLFDHDGIINVNASYKTAAIISAQYLSVNLI